jgi:hypothetical protein
MGATHAGGAFVRRIARKRARTFRGFEVSRACSPDYASRVAITWTDAIDPGIEDDGS